MSASGSVSKGVFVFKGKKSAANADDYFDDNGTSGQHRLAVFEDLWERTSMQIQLLQSELNTKLFEDLVEYVQGAQKGFVPGCGRKAGSQIVKEVPTAALVTGVNMPDHGQMFGTMMTAIRKNVTPHVATVHSKDCLKVHSMMAKVVGQLMDNADLLEDEDDEEEEGVLGRKVNGNMDVLSAWYKYTSVKPQQAKRRKSQETVVGEGYSPVVVVLEDLEGFPAHVLQDFVTICSNHLLDVPIVLVLGVATSVAAIHRALPHAVSSRLCIERFQAPPATDYLTQVLDQVILTPVVPFKLGGRVFNLLLDLFLFHDFSVLNFMRGYQLALLDHFYRCPVSILCQSPEDALDQLKVMKRHELDRLRSQRSFRHYVEKCEPQEQISLLEDDKYTKQCVLKMLEDIQFYHTCYYPALHCLHSLTKDLPKYPLGKQLREVYASNLSSNIADLPEYIQAFGLLRTLSKDELVAKLSELTKLLDNNDLPQELVDVRKTVEGHLDKLNHIEDLSRTVDEDEDEKEPELLPKRMDMFTLKKKLQEMDKKKRLTVYETLRNESLDFIDGVFKKYLLSPGSFPLHEVFYYDDITTMRQTMNGSPRMTIQRGLAQPYNYLQVEGCKCDANIPPTLPDVCIEHMSVIGFDRLRAVEGCKCDANIPPTLPDVCIAYKLHLECGRLINLYDWLQAFAMILQADDEDDRDKKPDRIMQARFIRAVSELQFLGFIKSTKRKTDHVARLTWGGC